VKSHAKTGLFVLKTGEKAPKTGQNWACLSSSLLAGCFYNVLIILYLINISIRKTASFPQRGGGVEGHWLPVGNQCLLKS
jgi:hypothetical protein